MKPDVVFTTRFYQLCSSCYVCSCLFGLSLGFQNYFADLCSYTVSVSQCHSSTAHTCLFPCLLKAIVLLNYCYSCEVSPEGSWVLYGKDVCE